jgi:hypothetical protein
LLQRINFPFCPTKKEPKSGQPMKSRGIKKTGKTAPKQRAPPRRTVGQKYFIKELDF